MSSEMQEELINLTNNDLLRIIRSDRKKAHGAFEELVGRAFGGNEDAQQITLRLEAEIDSGALTFEEEKTQDQSHTTPRGNRSSRPTGLLPPDRDPL